MSRHIRPYIGARKKETAATKTATKMSAVWYPFNQAFTIEMAMMTISLSSNQQPFHLWMKQRRAELDLSRTELADLVGCSLAMIRQLEQGRRRPSRQLAERLARYLQIAP